MPKQLSSKTGDYFELINDLYGIQMLNYLKGNLENRTEIEFQVVIISSSLIVSVSRGKVCIK